MAKSIVQQDQAPEPPPSDTLPWCICNHCRPMEHAVENICCRQRNCITLSTTFDGVVLDRSVLSVAIISRSDLFADDPDYSPAVADPEGFHWFPRKPPFKIIYNHALINYSC